MTASAWVRSSACADGSCVEVRRVGDVVEVRDSAGRVKSLTLHDWEVLCRGMRGGRSLGDTADLLRPLWFDLDELQAFGVAVVNGEFDLDRLRSEPAQPSADGLADVDPGTETPDSALQDRQLPDADTCERIFHAALSSGDIRGAIAALAVLAMVDPHRAEALLELTRAALQIRVAADEINPPKETTR